MVLSFVVAAILSTPDAFSQILMALPLLVLFELSIVASWPASLGRQRPAAVPE